jgi:hypothetical protein
VIVALQGGELDRVKMAAARRAFSDLVQHVGNVHEIMSAIKRIGGCMTKRLLLLLLAFCLVGTVTVAGDETVNAAIVAVVDEGYVQGIHLDGDVDKVRKGMHESFVMTVRTDTGVNKVTRDEWIARLKPRDASAPRPDVKADIVVLDQTGDAAVVKVRLFRDGKQIFTDYVSLYRIAGEWKMVGKTFQRM